MDPNFCSVETTRGVIRGLIHSGIREFKGVPYGAPTTGANRFKRPQPCARWTGVRDCLGYGPVSPQLLADIGNDYARLIHFDLNVAMGGMGEDCLHLNIWTPGTEPDAKRAVLFSIHGGGFAVGSGNASLYDGARLAGFGDVVVVTVTHRLAAFGYLNLADLDSTGEWADSGACGMLDLVAALEWVRDNIASFGGDPNAVMIFGQSGGGWKVSTLLAMPAARGLFSRAAVQSGSLLRHIPRENAAQVADALLRKLDLKRTRLGDIRDLSWRQLLAAQAEIGAHAFAPVLDGVNLPTDPFYPGAPQESIDIPLIVSTTLDDAGLFFNNFELSEAELNQLLVQRVGGRAERLLALYRELFPNKSPYLLHAQIVTDAGFRRFANSQAEMKAEQLRAPIYCYLWEYSSPAFDGKFGAVHGMDVSAAFCNDRDSIVGSGSRESQSMCLSLASAWVNFAKTGDPNNAYLPTWPAFDATRRGTMVLAADTRAVNDPYGPIRSFWREQPGPASVLG